MQQNELRKWAAMGLQSEIQRLTGQLELLKEWMPQEEGSLGRADGAPRKKRRLSAAARRRIGEVARRRWEEYRKAKAQAAGGPVKGKPGRKPAKK